MFGKIRNFVAEVRTELAKAQWPWDPNEKGFKRYKELSDSTMVVLIAMPPLLVGWKSPLPLPSEPRPNR